MIRCTVRELGRVRCNVDQTLPLHSEYGIGVDALCLDAEAVAAAALVRACHYPEPAVFSLEHNERSCNIVTCLIAMLTKHK